MLLAAVLDFTDAASVTVPPFGTVVGDAVAEVTWKLANAGSETVVSAAAQSNGRHAFCRDGIKSLQRQNPF